MSISTSSLKIKIGIILFLGNFAFAFFAALFYIRQWVSELDIILIGAGFVSVGPVAKSFFEAIADDRTDDSIYCFTENDLRAFVNSLRAEIKQHYNDKVEYYIIPKVVLHTSLGYPFDDLNSKIPTNLVALRRQIEILITSFASTRRGEYLSLEDLTYYLNKVVTWLRQNRSYESEKQVSSIAQNLMVLSAIAHPAIGILLLWVKAFNLVDLSPENLGTASALSSAVFSGFWVSTIKRLNANVIDS